MIISLTFTYHFIKQGSHTSEISKFTTISKLFSSSSQPFPNQSQHGSYEFSEAKLPTFPFFPKYPNYFAGHFAD